MRRGVGLVAFAAVVLMSVPLALLAQQSLEVAPPAPQSQPSFGPRPAPTARPQLPPSQQLEEIPPAITPTPVPPPPAPQLPPPPPPPPSTLNSQPMLPAIFRGCWDGRVEFLDSIEQVY